ncbi:regulatory protein, luxR family [Marinactinospora thermotolerans DSM 45154]|uniref:Regulatory protein, luxR family n=1 Tax=Marinactinospora thermotolerans DSM 45154 TaxID=1122192 RepID=A0A1T4MBY3_9ACTN|nr:helix-turn-helix transcriptional regulator [Marinactinospora thermotolerans]SJZ64234.1 regulatory protein, luxR family [Marinactinospora thermotolerans DSM 45154]
MPFHGSSPVFVGRSAELAALTEHAHRARTGSPSVMLLAGDAGIGKTRLLGEFARSSPTRVVTGGCLELGMDGLSFAPFVTVLRHLLRDLGRAPFDALAEDGEHELARLLPELGPVPRERREARGRLFEQVLRLLTGVAAPDGLTLVVEDLHWADPSTRDLLVFLIRNLTDAPVQVIVSFRSDDLHRDHPLRRLLPELQRLPTVDRLDLSPLTREEVARQAAAIRGGDLSPDEVATLHERAGGYPLFVESLLEDAGHDAGTLPERPRELLLAGLRRVDDAARSVIDIASVGALDGGRIGHELLAHVAELPETDLDTALRSAIDANILLVDGPGYRFRHALLREAVHQDLLPGQHTRLHLRWAEVIDAHPDLVPPDRLAVEQAHHYHAAREPARALGAAWRAARHAARSFGYAEELRMLERVIALWGRVADPGSLVDGLSLAEVFDHAAAAAFDSGEFARTLELCDTGLAELPASLRASSVPLDRGAADPTGTARSVTRGRLLRRRGLARIQLGEEAGIEDLYTALEVHPPDDGNYGFLLARLASELMLRAEPVPAGRLPAGHPLLVLIGRDGEGPVSAIELARAALSHTERHGDDCARSEALITLAALQAGDGLEAEARAAFDDGLALARAIGEASMEVRALGDLASLLRGRGEYAQARDLCLAGLERAREASLLRVCAAFVMVNLAEISVETGALREGLDQARQGLGWASSSLHRAHLNCLAGRISLALGDLDAARAAWAAVEREAISGRPRVNHALATATFTVELHQTLGDFDAALEAGLRATRDIAVERDPAYGWPLLDALARLLSPLGATDTAAARVAELRERVERPASLMEPNGPVQAALRRSIRARLADADGEAPDASRVSWQAMAEEWGRLGLPLARAEALLLAAEAAAVAGDRGGAAPLLRDAARLAGEAGAVPLERRAASLARRINVALDPSNGSTPPAPPAGLTPRETEVLRLLARGHTNAAIAAELFISAKTASVHVSNILAKLGVANRVAAAGRARELGLVH